MILHQHTEAAAPPRRFALRLAIFYGAVFGLVGTHLPFFPMWLGAIGIDPAWIGVIIAAPSVTRFTALPIVTALAERRHFVRGAMILAAFSTTFGFAAVAQMTHPVALLVVYALTAGLWTPLVPLTDAYALKSVARYGLNYGPLRLWGSAAFVAGALACGWLLEVFNPRHLIWVIVVMAAFGAAASLALAPTPAAAPSASGHARGRSLLRDPGFLAIIIASALIQGSHAAYYTFASIAWRGEGIGGLAIAALWVLGVLAEIVVFALSPRFTVAPATLVALAGLCAAMRWILTAQSPPFAALALIQLTHGISFGLTMVATMALLVRHVPAQIMASAQGLLAAATGIVMALTAISSGALYARIGQGLYGVMAAMALAGAAVIWAGRHRAGSHPRAP